MFRKEFAEVISKTGMIPLKDIRPLLADSKENVVTELKLLHFDFFDDIRFAKQVAQDHGLTFIDLSKAKILERTLKLIKKSDVVRYRVIPIQKNAKAVSLAIYDPTIVKDRAILQKLFQHPVEFILTNLSSWKLIYDRVVQTIEEIIDTIREAKDDSAQADAEVREADIGDDVIRFVNRILGDAFLKKASDIHVEPYEHVFRIRFRVDGALQEIARPPKSLMLPIISRIKILAKLDISERRKPQDGRIKLEIDGLPIDYRVSSLPTLFGEKVVLRLLDQSNLELDMTRLGFEKAQLSIFKSAIHKPYGMCLVTGPTGSGKTTTLYSALGELNQIGTNISTAEDPVEYNMEGINQVNIKKDIGLNFAAALKSFLRQDPDIIMVGEIRDGEVGEIAIEAALTGHLVLSTLHTNDAPSTISRLLNMGIEPFLITGALNVVVAQRLCRKICDYCRIEDTSVTVEEIISCGVSPSSAKNMKVYRGEGCDVCGESGHKGRVAIYEVLAPTMGLKELILANGSADELKMQGIKDGMKTLRMSAMTKVAQGLTTIKEAVTNSASDKF